MIGTDRERERERESQENPCCQCDFMMMLKMILGEMQKFI